MTAKKKWKVTRYIGCYHKQRNNWIFGFLQFFLFDGLLGHCYHWNIHQIQIHPYKSYLDIHDEKYCCLRGLWRLNICLVWHKFYFVFHRSFGMWPRCDVLMIEFIRLSISILMSRSHVINKLTQWRAPMPVRFHFVVVPIDFMKLCYISKQTNLQRSHSNQQRSR